MKLGVVTCVRDEADVLAPWLAYHAALGVSRGYVYMDRCRDGTREVLRPFPWVVPIARDRLADENSLVLAQMACMDDALVRARADGLDWLMHIDVDAYAFAENVGSSALERGDLRVLLASVPAETEAVVLRTVEVVPTALSAGEPFWKLHAVQDRTVFERAMLDPKSGAVRPLARWLGHNLGKSIARVAADLQAGTPHRFTRRQEGKRLPDLVPIVEEQRGCHYHFVVRDARHWVDKYRKIGDDSPFWPRGTPVEFPTQAWKEAARYMTDEEGERYARRWVLAAASEIGEARARGAVREVRDVESVLGEIGWTRVARRSTPRRRVALVGIDAADPELITEWARAGHLPTFARLLERGLIGRTKSPPGVFVSAIWPSLITGVNPGKHGCHSWEQLVPGTYDVKRFHAADGVTRAPFWSALARAGHKVVLLDVPLSGLTPHPNVTQILEWGCHDPEHGYRAYPPELGREVAASLGLHPSQGNCNAWRDTAAHIRFRDDLVRGVAMRSRLHAKLLDRDDWDLFFTVYGESHCIGHQAWHIHDREHVRHDPAQAAAVGDPVLDVYRAIDASVGELLEILGDETLTIVFPSHGMRAHYDPTFLLDEMLARLEGANAPAARPRSDRLYFPITNNQVEGAIRLNVVGREPNGRIARGREFDRVCDELVADLAKFVDADTGRPLVAAVLKTRELYHGEHVDDLPDLFVQWVKGGYIHRVQSPKTGLISGEYEGVRSGDHTPIGLFSAVGAGLGRGHIGSMVDVLDFAPTLAALFDVSLDDADGAPIPELLGASREERLRSSA